MFSFTAIAVLMCLCAIFLLSVVDFSVAMPGGHNHGGSYGINELLVAGLLAKMFQQGWGADASRSWLPNLQLGVDTLPWSRADVSSWFFHLQCTNLLIVLHRYSICIYRKPTVQFLIGSHLQYYTLLYFILANAC